MKGWELWLQIKKQNMTQLKMITHEPTFLTKITKCWNPVWGFIHYKENSEAKQKENTLPD